MKKLLAALFIASTLFLLPVRAMATVSSTDNKLVYVGDDTTTIFPYNFKIFEEAHLNVILIITATEAETVQVITTDYTVSGVDVEAGGNVTMVTAPASTEKLVIKRVLPLTQGTDLVDNTAFSLEVLEENYDRGIMIDQQLQESINRATLVGIANSSGYQLPLPVGDKHIAWNSAANALVNVDAAAGTFLWEISGSETQLITADEIDMQSKKIINLLDPTANQHAASKKYVDDQISASVPDAIWDADLNTGIQTEESANENIIRIDINGAERGFWDTNGLRIKNGYLGLNFDPPSGSYPSIRMEKAGDGAWANLIHFYSAKAGQLTNWTDYFNLFIGPNAGNVSTTGDGDNIGIGSNALNTVTTGWHNICLGYFAGRDITTGDGNIAIGNQTMGRSSDVYTGDFNVYIGHQSGWDGQTGDENVVIGPYADSGDGSYNVAIGSAAGDTGNTPYSYTTCIGADATPTASNQAVIQFGTSNVVFDSTGITYGEGQNFIIGTVTGTKFGTGTNQLIGFYNATPVNQPATVSDAATQDLTGGDTVDKTKTEADLTSLKNAINAIIDRLQELGLIA